MLLNLEVFGQNGESYEEIFQILCLIKQIFCLRKGNFYIFFFTQRKLLFTGSKNMYDEFLPLGMDIYQWCNTNEP